MSAMSIMTLVPDEAIAAAARRVLTSRIISGLADSRTVRAVMPTKRSLREQRPHNPSLGDEQSLRCQQAICRMGALGRPGGARGAGGPERAECPGPGEDEPAGRDG